MNTVLSVYTFLMNTIYLSLSTDSKPFSGITRYQTNRIYFYKKYIPMFNYRVFPENGSFSYLCTQQYIDSVH